MILIPTDPLSLFAYAMFTVTHVCLDVLNNRYDTDEISSVFILRKENVLNSEFSFFLFFQLTHLFKRFALYSSIFFDVADSKHLFQHSQITYSSLHFLTKISIQK